MINYTQKDIERFYNKITIVTEGPDTGCWNIDYASNQGGYTKTSIKGKHIDSHRFMYLIQHPEENIDNLCVCHSCDHPWCVNPDHLWLGTDSDNVLDKIYKGRQLKGSEIGTSSLNEDLVKEILDNILNNNLMNITKIAKKYQVCKWTISNIINCNGWFHVTKNYDMIKIKTIVDENRYTLSHCDIRNIRNRLKIGETQTSIAKDYNVSISLIGSIKRNKTYSYVI
jgi:hypothetical protein